MFRAYHAYYAQMDGNQQVQNHWEYQYNQRFPYLPTHKHQGADLVIAGSLSDKIEHFKWENFGG